MLFRYQKLNSRLKLRTVTESGKVQIRSELKLKQIHRECLHIARKHADQGNFTSSNSETLGRHEERRKISDLEDDATRLFCHECQYDVLDVNKILKITSKYTFYSLSLLNTSNVVIDGNCQDTQQPHCLYLCRHHLSRTIDVDVYMHVKINYEGIVRVLYSCTTNYIAKDSHDLCLPAVSGFRERNPYLYS